MYYIAGITRDGTEMGCDFGFDMVERILLDEVLLNLPPKLMGQLVIVKRFSYFGDKPNIPNTELVGKGAGVLQNLFNFVIARDYCQATVVNRNTLLLALKRAIIKLVNMPSWRCGKIHNQPQLFSDVAIYSPHLLRLMLGREKYGEWDHAQDRKKALGVLNKFTNFLSARDDLKFVFICNDLFCPHWEASGEMYFSNKGILTYFNYFGQGNGQSYKYYPQMGVWQRK